MACEVSWLRGRILQMEDLLLRLRITWRYDWHQSHCNCIGLASQGGKSCLNLVHRHDRHIAGIVTTFEFNLNAIHLNDY